jgi:membrane protein implicated in regulation of membrane protease activity
MNVRLILAIASTLLEETALAIIVLVGLPQLDIHLPLVVLVALMVVWAVVAVLVYRAGSRALDTRSTSGPDDIIGRQGKVVQPLQPDGLVRIGGELWRAKAIDGDIDSGREVTAVERKGTVLIVQPKD